MPEHQWGRGRGKGAQGLTVYIDEETCYEPNVPAIIWVHNLDLFLSCSTDLRYLPTAGVCG